MRTKRSRAARLLVLLPALVLLLAPLRPASAGFGGRDPDDPSKLNLLVYFDYEPDEAEYVSWERIFAEFSQDLYDATEAQLRLGKVTFTTSIELRTRADVWIHQSSYRACAALRGLNQKDRWIHLYRNHQCNGDEGQDYAYANLNACSDGVSPIVAGVPCDRERGQFGLLHEAGHYLFGLGDEYLGCTKATGAACDDQEPHTVGELQPGATQTREVALDVPAGDVVFRLEGATGARLRLDLVSPNRPSPVLSAETVTPQAPPGAPSRAELRLEAPETGTWTFVLTNEGSTPQAFELFLAEDHAFSCAHQEDEATGRRGRLSFTASIMDGGSTARGRNVRREFCVSGLKEGDDAHTTFGHRILATSTIDGVEYEHSSDQETLNAGSCWDTLIGKQRDGTDLVSVRPATEPEDFYRKSRLLLTKYTTPLPVPQTLPSEPEIVIQRITGTPGIMMLIDKSRSMLAAGPGQESAFSLAQGAAKSALGALSPQDLIGLISFDSEVKVFNEAAPIAAATSTWRERLKSEIDVPPRDGNTATGGALEQACEILSALEPDRVSTKSVILFSDGVNTVGASPLEVLTDNPACEDVRIHTIALGPNADRDTLQELAARTGGEFYAVLDSTQLLGILPGIVRRTRGETLLLDVGDTVQAGAPQVFEVDVSPLAGDVTFQLTGTQGSSLRLDLTSPSGSDVVIANGEACVLDPRVGGDVCNIDYTQGAANDPTWAYRIPNPQPGVWKVTVTNLGADGAFNVLAAQTTPRAAVDARVLGPEVVRYPDPIVIEVSVVSDAPVAGADVTAVLTAPGGATTDLVLFDDGAPEHGDRTANDGIYSALFTEYDDGANGTYTASARVAVDCATARAAKCFEDGEPPAGELRIASFDATAQVSVVVTNVPDRIESGTVLFFEASTDTVVGPIQADEVDVTPFMPFRLTATGESVQLRSVTVTSGATANLASLDEVSLFLDRNADGLPDNRNAPLAYTRFDASGTARFARPDGGTLVVLLADETTHFVLGFGSRRQPGGGGAQPKPAPAQGGLPLAPPPTWVLVLALATTCLALAHRLTRRAALRPMGVAGCTALICVFVMTGGVGCGSSGGGGLDTAQVGITSPPADPAPGDYTITLNPATLDVIGATSKDRLSVSGDPFVQVIRIEAPPLPPIVPQTVEQPNKRTYNKGGW